MITLSYSISHNSSVALMKNGRIICAAQEERFKKIKNYFGFPAEATSWCLKYAGISTTEIDQVIFTTINSTGLQLKLKAAQNFNVSDWYDYYGEKFFEKKLKGEKLNRYFKNILISSKFGISDDDFNLSYLNEEILSDSDLDIKLFKKSSINKITEIFGIRKKNILFIDHHKCHASYAYFASPFRKKDCIILTLDAEGDGKNLSVSVAKDDKINLLESSAECDLGRIYKMTTLLLNLKPNEHEFKVMGLAPYAKDEYTNSIVKKLKEILKIDDLKIVRYRREQNLFKQLKKIYQFQRFDNIAGAVQKFLEEVVSEWIISIHNKLGIDRFVFSGGLSLNVKLNKVIQELKCVKEFFVCGSGGDESLSIGGCYIYQQENGIKTYPLKNLYLGKKIMTPSESFLKKYNLNMRKISVEEIANLISTGNIIANVNGKEEFGARALGNRSILADPRDYDNVKKINEAIKNRDFWMPFALSILKNFNEKYLVNSKKIQSPFMATSFDTNLKYYKDIIAGTHPYDKTVRPQFVDHANNKFYFDLIFQFYKLTGVPALLNTSLNLHGKPLVHDIEDVINTYKNSNIDYILINKNNLIFRE